MRNKRREMPDEYWKWLDGQLSVRGWTSNQLARQAGLAQSALSKARPGRQALHFEACLAIVRALDAPAVMVLQLAGLLEVENAKPLETPEAQEYLCLFMQLPERERGAELAALRARAECQRRASRKSEAGRSTTALAAGYPEKDG